MEGSKIELHGWGRNTGNLLADLNSSVEMSPGNKFQVSRICLRYWIFQQETSWSSEVRLVIYILALVYCFIGIAASTATFMRAMEVMVRQTRTVQRKDTITGVPEVREERIWNATVADITLLAVGTSIPPIAISIIEAFEKLSEMEDSGIGVGIVVGSAAFNLLATSAVCVLVPTEGSVKRFESLGVYIVELIWSVWAYVWLLLVLKVSSPGVVTLWEAITTALQFPHLILHAYAQDKQWSFIAIPLEPSMWARLEHGSPENLTASYFQEASARGTLPTSTADEEYSRASWEGVLLMWKKNLYFGVNSTVANLEVNLLDTLFQFRGPSDDFSLPYAIRHLIMLPWNILFAFIPPVILAHGWVTYLSAILVLAGVSEVIIQLADTIGCVSGISSYLLSISVLAAGSSWPVLIASRISTKYASTADAAIANVNCSNSINSFVGIGIPWVVHATYNRFILDNKFGVPTDGITFSLILFCVLAIVCAGVLAARRYYLDGEFGGPRVWAWASSALFFGSWVAFVILSCLNFTGSF